MRLHYQINKRYLTTGTRQLCEPVATIAAFRYFLHPAAMKVKRPPSSGGPVT
jgi:hypothetical protein